MSLIRIQNKTRRRAAHVQLEVPFAVAGPVRNAAVQVSADVGLPVAIDTPVAATMAAAMDRGGPIGDVAMAGGAREVASIADVEVELELEADAGAPAGLARAEERPSARRTSRERPAAPSKASKPGKPSKSRESAKPSKPAKSGRPTGPTNPELIAQAMAGRQREISVAEFFAKNRHLLGFDNPAKALLTTVKEAVDNSLDACEEAGILPDLQVELTQLSEERFRVAVEDNGPGIVRAQVPKIFAKLLYGSKFHSMKQSRGQQGIGISAAGMYGLLTTGKPLTVISRTGSRTKARRFQVAINTKLNAPDIQLEEEIEWEREHGTRVEITLQGTYKKGRHSIDGYLLQVSVANPHAQITYVPPVLEGEQERVVYDRTSDVLPKEPKEIRPHPHGVELGVFLKMLQGTAARNLQSFLQQEFSRVGKKVIDDLFAAGKEAGLSISPRTRPRSVSGEEAEALHTLLGRAKIMAPPTDCLSPIGEELLLAALQNRVRADFYTAVTRPPAVYRGNPFQIEAALAYGGELPGDELIEVYRYANRVPLQYQRGACAITKAVVELPWRNYKIPQSRGALPAAPMILVVNIASVWVPFTSESKEAVAHYPEILMEIRRALQECGRRAALHISRHMRAADEHKKQSYIQKYIPHIGIALQEILGLTDQARDKTVDALTDTLERSRKM
jgi:DNA topoisomerase VI subunit B